MIGELRFPHGVLVAKRSADSPSSDQALEPGDVIVSMNGVPAKALADLRSIVGRLPSNASVVFQVQRFGQLMFIALELP